MEIMRKIPKASMDDEEIIRSVLNGNRNDYEFIMRRYNERLYRIGISILKDESDVEDIMQETYIKAYKNLETFKQQSKFSTWLTRIMVNESLAKLKYRKRFEQLGDTETDNTPSYFTHSETPEKQFMQKELRGIIENAVKSLPQKYQTVFMMREIENMNVQETAKSLNITNENVKVRLHRAKELLKTNITLASGTPEIFPFLQNRCDRVVSFVLENIRS
ncbi:MAG: RNA polymerase sigma factor [Melioribacter sp.]|nr:RNA polymerase sigma factor [Melioribacter sp.]